MLNGIEGLLEEFSAVHRGLQEFGGRGVGTLGTARRGLYPGSWVSTAL